MGDEVLVAFERGDLRFPCVVGSLWNGDHKPPETNADGRNDIRTVRTRKGHALRFDDGVKGGVRLELNDGKAITIDEGGITIDASNGNRVVIDSASGATTIEAASALRIRAPQNRRRRNGVTGHQGRRHAYAARLARADQLRRLPCGAPAARRDDQTSHGTPSLLGQVAPRC